MTAFVMLFSLIIGSVLQASLPALPRIGYAQPPLLLSIVVYYALTTDRATTVWAAVLGGLLCDTMGLMPLGYSAFAYCVAGLVSQSFRDMVIARQWTTHVVFGGLANFGVVLLSYMLLAKDGLVGLGILGLIGKLLVALILGAVVTPLVFTLMEKFDHTVGNVEEEQA